VRDEGALLVANSGSEDLVAAPEEDRNASRTRVAVLLHGDAVVLAGGASAPAKDEDQRSEGELHVLLLVRASGRDRSVDTQIRAVAECPNGRWQAPCWWLAALPLLRPGAAAAVATLAFARLPILARSTDPQTAATARPGKRDAPTALPTTDGAATAQRLVAV
jgi:hypothetical protein